MDMFIYGLAQGSLQAIQAETGAIVWEQDAAHSSAIGSGGYAQGLVVLLFLDGYAQGRDASTGALVWENQVFPLGNLQASDCRTQTSQAHIVLVYGKRTAMLRPTDGAVLWSQHSSAFQVGVLGLSASYVFLAEIYPPTPISRESTSDDATQRELHRAILPTIVTSSFEVNTGNKLWSTSLLPVNLAPRDGGVSLVDDGEVIYLCANGLYAISAQAGTVIWKLDRPTPTRAAELIKLHDIVVWISTSLATAVDIKGRHILWQEEVPLRDANGLAVEQYDRLFGWNDAIYTGHSHFNPGSFVIEKRHPRTGAIQTTFPPQNLALDPQSAGNVQQAGSVLVIPATDAVYAFDAPTGKRLWDRSIGADESPVGIAVHMEGV